MQLTQSRRMHLNGEITPRQLSRVSTNCWQATHTRGRPDKGCFITTLFKCFIHTPVQGHIAFGPYTDIGKFLEGKFIVRKPGEIVVEV